LNSVLEEPVFDFSRPPLIKVDLGERSQKLYLTDTTLRDGQQAWRVLSVEESLKIYEVLAEISGEEGVVRTTELFLYTPKDRAVVSEVKNFGAKFPEPIGWIRSSRDELRLVLESKLSETTILTSISSYHIRYKLNLDESTAIQKYLDVAEEAMKHGVVPRCTLEDVTRADLHGTVKKFVTGLIRLSEKHGTPFRLKLPDTLGVGLPFPEVPPPRGIPRVVKAILEFGVPPDSIIFHGHNDFGMAVANSLAAWLYGANGVETTLAGIGERAGNTPMEPMLLHLSGLRRGVSLRSVKRVRAVLEELGFEVPPFYPVIGKNAFKTKAGIHIDGLLKNPFVYLPFDPVGVLGMPYSVDITPYSGKSGVLLWLKSRMPDVADGLHKDHPLIQSVYSEVVRLFESTGRTEPLSDDEMAAIVKKFLG